MKQLSIDNFSQFSFKHWALELFEGFDFQLFFERLTYFMFDLLLMFVISWLVYKLTELLFLRIIEKVIRKSDNKWDDILVEKKVFSPLLLVVPAVGAWLSAPQVFGDLPAVIPAIQTMSKILLAIGVTVLVNNAVSALELFFDRKVFLRDKPVHSYAQLLKIINVVIGIIFIISFILQSEVEKVLIGLGSLTAVFILVFKDTILGFVSSLQISANDMVRVGDWVTMPNFGADGTVQHITLTVVKIQNFDKTISTVPTYAFITTSFQNWRGMTDSGVRRIKRSLNVNMKSVRFVDGSFVAKLKADEVLGKRLEAELERYSKDFSFDNLTNLTLYRCYVEGFLREHPLISNRFMQMVRQLQPGPEGIPLEVYAFTKTTDWQHYENIQSDVFDHLIACAGLFDLEVFQNVSGADVLKISSPQKKPS
ncbi:MAG: mechanosensitive ion channel family protein [Cytophagales bacterium]|nr:mechanosensitive ion channel family protein [Cytophagales bacterium]